MGSGHIRGGIPNINYKTFQVKYLERRDGLAVVFSGTAYAIRRGEKMSTRRTHDKIIEKALKEGININETVFRVSVYDILSIAGDRLGDKALEADLEDLVREVRRGVESGLEWSEVVEVAIDYYWEGKQKPNKPGGE
jgi:hypothetical protein